MGRWRRADRIFVVPHRRLQECIPQRQRHPAAAGDSQLAETPAEGSPAPGWFCSLLPIPGFFAAESIPAWWQWGRDFFRRENRDPRAAARPPSQEYWFARIRFPPRHPAPATAEPPGPDSGRENLL